MLKMVEITKFDGDSGARFINITDKKVVMVYFDGRVERHTYTKSPKEIEVSFKDFLDWLGANKDTFFDNIAELIRENE